MNLKAKVVKVEVIKNRAFHEKTGEPHPSYFLEATVVDTGVEIPVKYRCSFRGSLGAERLYQAYKDKLTEVECDAIAADVQTKAKQLIENQEVVLLVEDMRVNNDSITLLVKKV